MGAGSSSGKTGAVAKRVLFVTAGVALALILASPYILFRAQIQQMAAVGYVGLILACAASNVSILLPSSATLIVLAAATSLDPILCVVCGGLGTSLGEQSSYLCGRIGRLGFDDREGQSKRVVNWLRKHAFATIFAFAFVPLPVFDIVGIASGAMKISWPKYALAAVLGKLAKFALAVAGVFYVLPVLLPHMRGPGRIILEKMLEQLGLF